MKKIKRFISSILTAAFIMAGMSLPAVKAADSAVTEADETDLSVGIVSGTPVALSFDASLIGEEITVTDDEGNETTGNSYQEISADGEYVLLNTGDYFTYTINVGEGQQITAPGGYKVTYEYASTAASTVEVSSMLAGASNYTDGGKTTLAASGAIDTFTTYTEDEYVTLAEGENKIKLSITSAGDDGVAMKMPTLTRFTSGAVINYPINKNEIPLERKVNSEGNPTNKAQITTGKYMGNLSNTNINISSHVNATQIMFRNLDYIVMPVTVPYTSAYKIEFKAKFGKSFSTVIKGAFSTESLSAAKDLAFYDVESAACLNTGTYKDYTISDSYVLEGGKQYYFKVHVNTGSDNYINLANIRFTDTGEYETDSDLASLKVKCGHFTPAFDKEVMEYTVYAPVSSAGTAEITATADVAGASVTIGSATAETSLTADEEISYGINLTPVEISVTSRNGENTKTYKINFVGVYNHASLGITNAKLYRSTAPETAVDVQKLFNGTGVVATNGSGDAGFGTNATGSSAYIDIDLGEKYDLCELTWEMTNQGNYVTGLTVWGSNDPLFETYELIGTSDGKYVKGTATGIAHKVMSIALSATEAYRYVRLNKPKAANSSFFPVKMDVYGLPLIRSEVAEDGLTTTVTVPSRYFVVGDKAIAASRNADGVLTSVDAVDAPNAEAAELILTKENAEDEVKVMVWESFVNMVPRVKEMVIEQETEQEAAEEETASE